MRLLIVLMVFAGCSKLPGRGDGGTGAGGGTAGGTAIVLPQLPPVPNLVVFGPGATKLLADVSNARVELDPTQRDALTALGECADLLTYCYAPPAFTLARCFSTVRACATSTPWTEAACCPADCRTAFTREVAAGLSPNRAFEKVLFLEPDCFPGVRAALEAP
jgi:hypothetical protein